MSTGEDNKAVFKINDNLSVDLMQIYEIAGGDEQYVAKVIETFLKSLPGALDKIEEAINNEKWDDVYKSAHFAKSSLSVIRIGNMWETAMNIEKNAKNRAGLELIPDLYNNLKHQYQQSELVLIEKFSIGK